VLIYLLRPERRSRAVSENRTGKAAFIFMKIAQPFMAGYDASQIKKSRQGRQNDSFVPGGTCKFNGRLTQP
jgi:hypothetical protein